VLSGSDALTSPTVIDLFCGAGGLIAGLESAGWRTVTAVDRDRDCIASLERNKANKILIGTSDRAYLDATRTICAPVEDISGKELRPSGAPPGWRVDLLAGGPPCQPFSSAGQMRGVRDPRGRLFLEFVRIAEELNPRFILFENVAGLITAKSPNGKPGGVLRSVQRAFESIGYACKFELINSADLGSAQRRNRLLMIGSRSERLPDFPTATHSRYGDLDGMKRWLSLGQFLSEQPAPDEGEIVRPSQFRRGDLERLVPGTGIRAAGIVEANRPSGHWGYRQDCFLADLSLPSRTIRAASTPDWVRLSDGELRRLTWRECAALQGFHRDWFFEGGMASRFRQIGNAVQGEVAQALGKILYDAVLARRRARPQSSEWPASFQRRVRYTAAEDSVNGQHRLVRQKSSVA
jgi:DNA (cytosine-5)-methyltransferase 1